MFPVNTRPIIRSVSPPPRRRPSTSSSEAQTEHESSDDSPTVEEDPVRVAAQPRGGSVSIRAAVREYEVAHDEITLLNARVRKLRARMHQMRSDVETFMRERNLERIGTRDGRLVVHMTTKSQCMRPGKKETHRCIQETLGDEHPELAQDLLRRLYEENRQVRTFTRFDKKPISESSAAP